MNAATTLNGASVSPDPKGFESSYQSWALLVKHSKTPHDHADHAPKSKTFGISEEEAKWIRARVDREMRRTF